MSTKDEVGLDAQASAVRDFALTLINLAKEEGIKFKEENGREPTETEAKRIAAEIQRQLKIAIIMHGGSI